MYIKKYFKMSFYYSKYVCISLTEPAWHLHNNEYLKFKMSTEGINLIYLQYLDADD